MKTLDGKGRRRRNVKIFRQGRNKRRNEEGDENIKMKRKHIAKS